MAAAAGRALYQGFLPSGRSRAFVWKYSEVNRGRRPRHFHIEPELNLVAAGWASFGVGRAVVRVSAGELLCFPPGQDHVLLDASPDVYLYSVGMDPSLAAELRRGERDYLALSLRARLASAELASLLNRCTDIVEREGTDQRGAELWQHSNWLRGHQATHAEGALHVLTRRAIDELSRAPEQGRASLARTLRANPTDISRYFHRDVGVTLVQFRARLRLLQLIRFVDQGADNLKESASAAGFGSYSQCHRVFRAELGCAPRDFFSAGVRQRMQQAYLL